MSNEVEQEINRYLMRIASYLGSEERVDEITMELRTHIEDRALELAEEREVRVDDVWRAMNELGEPREVAQGYLQPVKPSKVFISDELYPYFLRTIAVLSVLIVLIGLLRWIGRGHRGEDLARTILVIELAIPAVVGIMFVVFVYFSREGYTLDTLIWNVKTFLEARKADFQELGDGIRAKRERRREEKLLREEWKRQREAELRMEQERRREETRLQKSLKRQRKFERSIRSGQPGELIGAIFTVALALFIISPYARTLIAWRVNPQSPPIPILKPAFFDELVYIVVFLLTISAMIHFATFVMGRTQVLYLARVGSTCMELGFNTFLLTNITRFVYEIVIQVSGIPNIVVTYENIQILLAIAILANLISIFRNTYRAVSYPKVLPA